MDLNWLRAHVQELKLHLDHFQQMLHQLEMMYQRSQRLQTTPEIQSALMERYIINLTRQQKAIESMSELYKRALAQLTRLETQYGETPIIE